MLLALDTETSGLMKEGLDLLAPEQPAMVQMGAHLYDGMFRKRGRLSVLIRPEGWTIEPAAQDVHGISTRDCSRYGVSLAEALILLRALVGNASRIIGHNVQFDRRVIAAAIHRAGGTGAWWTSIGQRFLCTMEASTPVLQLPGEYGYKFPTLEEAMHYFYDPKWASSHDADSDIEATVLVYRALLDQGHVPEIELFGGAK